MPKKRKVNLENSVAVTGVEGPPEKHQDQKPRQQILLLRLPHQKVCSHPVATQTEKTWANIGRGETNYFLLRSKNKMLQSGIRHMKYSTIKLGRSIRT